MFTEQQLSDFEAEHSKDGDKATADGNAFLFPTGARMNCGYGGFSVVPPPQDEYARARLIRQYWFIRIAKEVERFNMTKRNIAMHIQAAKLQGQHPSISPADATAELEKIKREIRKVQKRHTRAERAVEKAKPKYLKLHEEHTVAARAALEELTGAVESVRI